MSRSKDYIRLVHWSEEDQLFIGRSPGLFLGGVHGENEEQVYAELLVAIDDWVESAERDGFDLPPPTANRSYSGKFNLRVGSELHELLALEAMKVSESLNTYVVKTLKNRVGQS